MSPSNTSVLYQSLRGKRVFRDNRSLVFFIPVDELERLITVPVVEKILREHEKPHDVALKCALDVEKFAKRLFAILVLVGDCSAICSLLDGDLSDQDLPFLYEREGNKCSLLRREPKEPIEAFENWTDENIETFSRTQWNVLAPVFDKGSMECTGLLDDVILPFIELDPVKKEKEQIPILKAGGGYSEVTARRIHQAHHNFWELDESLKLEKHPLIAVKKLNSTSKIEFLKEKTILDAIGRDNHPHLISLLTSYCLEEHYYLIFPCADCNLRRYWAKEKSPKFDRETVMWSIRQMLGIASGLERVHTFKVDQDLNTKDGNPVSKDPLVKLIVLAGEEKYGRHGDIKPANILFFKDEKLLKIADFGLGRFHGRDSRSRIDPTKVAGTLTYEPPECSLGHYVSRKYDIWSLGCLFLEFATWLLLGGDKIEEFSNARGLEIKPIGPIPINDDTFFTVFNVDPRVKDARVREAVVQWVDSLHADEKCSAVIHDLLHLVMDSMLKIDQNDRKTAVELAREMENLVSEAESSPTYLLDAVPTPLPTRPHPSPQPDETPQLDEMPQPSGSQLKRPKVGFVDAASL